MDVRQKWSRFDSLISSVVSGETQTASVSTPLVVLHAQEVELHRFLH